MDLIKNNTVERDGYRGVDRLTRLPPELMGNIYHHLLNLNQLYPGYFDFSDDNRFLPVAKSLIHFQRENLYRIVGLHPASMVNFCETMSGSSSLAEIVKRLKYRASDGGRYDRRGNLIGAATLETDQAFISILPHLVHLESLTIKAPSIMPSIFTSYARAPEPSTLTSLELQLDDYSLLDLLLPLFPSLHNLFIFIAIDIEPTASDILSDPVFLHPPRSLESLAIEADHRSQAVCNLIASTAAQVTRLEGRCVYYGLASVRNLEVIEELTLTSYSLDQAPEQLDESLLEFTNVTALSLGGPNLFVSDQFFTDYFQIDSPLRSLYLTPDFELHSSDWIRAFKTIPITLKSVILDSWVVWGEIEASDWLHAWRERGFDKAGVEKIIAIYTEGGVEVSGSGVDIVELITQHLDSEVEDSSSEEEDSSSEDEDEEEEDQSQDDDEVEESEDEETVHGVDRLSILPPNLIGVIYDNLDSDAGHHFRPIVRSLLHSQRNNLYRRVEFTSKLRFAKFCRTLSGTNGNELGGMVKAMLLDSLSIKGDAEDDEAEIGSAQREWEAMVIEGQVQLILPKLTRLRSLQVHRTAPASRPVIPFFSSPTSSRSSLTITTLRLELEDYCLIHLILPLFPNLLNLALVLLSPASELEMDPTTPVAPLDSTTQPRHLDRLIIGGEFIVPSLCSIVASTEATFTTLSGHTMHTGLLALKNSERMENLTIYCQDKWEDTEDHGQALVNFTNVKKLILGWRIRVEHSFFSDLFESIPRMESLSLMDGFPLVASDLISAIETNPIVGLRLELDFVEFEGVEKTGVAWPGGCQAEGVRAIMVACGAVADAVVTGSAVNIVKRLDKLALEG